jgi:hypothetical protein
MLRGDSERVNAFEARRVGSKPPNSRVGRKRPVVCTDTRRTLVVAASGIIRFCDTQAPGGGGQRLMAGSDKDASSPQKLLVAWWDEVPPAVRARLGPGVFHLLLDLAFPGRELTDYSDAVFRAALAHDGDGAAIFPGTCVAGRVLMFAAAIDFEFLLEWTSDRQDAVEERNREAAEAQAGHGNLELADEFHRYAESVRFCAAMWQREASRWTKLRSGPLSPEAVHAWLYSSA